MVFSIHTVWKISTSKSVQPFLIEVEKKSGIVTVVSSKSIDQLTAKDALKRSFIMQYISARDGYNPELIEYNYSKIVRSLSSPGVWYDFKQFIGSTNPDNPARKYGSGPFSVRSVRIRSIVFTSEASAQVRFTLVNDRDESKNENKIAIMEFGFQDLSLDPDERLINPLGFTVTKYRVDNEVT